MTRSYFVYACILSCMLLSPLASQPRAYSTTSNPDTTYVAVGSQIAIATTIQNPNEYSVSYVAIYLVLNSTGYTTSVEEINGQLPSGGNGTTQTSWTAEKAGTYQVSTFIVSSLDVPELLMPTSTKIVNAVDDQSSAGLTQTISDYGTIASSSPNSRFIVKAGSLPSLEQLREYALQKINEDRANYTTSPVRLSSNPAAQAQSDEMLSTKFLSHWSADGMKPYMRYSAMGGEGYVAQNVAGGPLSSYPMTTLCGTSTISLCSLAASSLYNLIDQSDYNLVNNDVDCCENLHMGNLLDPFHTDVSIGISYDNYSFYMVQNFENNYIAYDRPITTDNKTITISGKTLTGTMSQVLIYYDDLPSSQTYLQNRDQTTYDPGEIVAGVVPDSSQYTDIVTINATEWQPGPTINVSFDMSPIMTKPGVYTIYSFIDDGHNHRIVVTSYSIFHESQ